MKNLPILPFPQAICLSLLLLFGLAAPSCQKALNTPASVSPALAATDEAELQALAAFLKSLPKEEAPSIGKAAAYYAAHFAKSNPATCDAAFGLVFPALNTLRDTIMNAYFAQTPAQLTNNPAFEKRVFEALEKKTVGNFAAFPAAKRYTDNGLTFRTSEGMVFLGLAPDFMAEHFTAGTSEAVPAFIKLYALSENDPAAEDGGFAVPVQEVADRVVQWETFNAQYPAFVLAAWTRNTRQSLAEAFLLGLNNTPAFDYGDEGVATAMSPDFKQAFAYVLKNHPTSRLAAQVRPFYALIGKEGFVKTPAVAAYMQGLQNKGQ